MSSFNDDQGIGIRIGSDKIERHKRLHISSDIKERLFDFTIWIGCQSIF